LLGPWSKAWWRRRWGGFAPNTEKVFKYGWKPGLLIWLPGISTRHLDVELTERAPTISGEVKEEYVIILNISKYIAEDSTMAKVLLVYESKYGNTKLVAETIVAGITEVSDNKTTIYELKEIELKQPPDFDVVLIGSPNHAGGPTGGIKKFINELGKLDVKGKYAAVFDTYMAKDYEKAVKKMEKRIIDKVPEIRLLTPSLSIRVDGMKGPISEGELPKCKDFGGTIASQVGR
jgi:flavodoxin